MTEIERLHGLKTTKRKWKEMLKNWNFKKNTRTYVWQWMCSKRATRHTQEDKETVFHYRHKDITPEMLEQFENRKITIAHAVNVATPKDVRYYTPCPTEADSSPEEMCERFTPFPSTPSETSSTFQDSVRHHHSLCSFGPEAETDRTSKMDLPPRSLDKPVDRWLSDEHQPWSHFNLPHELSDDEDITSNNEDILGDFRGLEDLFQEQGDLPELRCIGTQSFLEDAANDVIALAGESEQYEARHAKHTPQALTVCFNLAQALEKIGKHEEAENHYRKILSIESRINVQTSLGMILAKSGRLERSTTLLFQALTGFIVYYSTYSLLESEWLFDLIFELFVETVSRRGEKWDAFSEYMDQMQATLRNANSDEDMHRIWPQLFIHGFSFAHQCYILGVIRSAECLYKYLLECPTVHFDNPHHQFEKFKAHHMYGLLLRKEKRWKPSAKQLLLACKSVMESCSYDRRLIRLFRVIFSDLRPHLASQLHQEDALADGIEAILVHMWNEVPAPKHPHDSWVENYLQSDLPRDVANFDLSDLVISNHFAQLTLPVQSTASSRIDKGLSTTASITRTLTKSIWANLSESLSGYESHKLALTFSDEENFGVSDWILESQKF